ncbi:hypothetical protein WBG78_27600 [Chryseolinea sp. T2]|uniref:hypothetical protein n=1 Tax=Chryseolinea sp. T2 TaxID=3129255 RepID=UPI003078487D
MEKDADGSLSYYVSLRSDRRDDIARIRHWSNLKIAFDADAIWIKGLDYAQVQSVEVRSMPYKTAWYEKGNRLFLIGHNLPERNVPSVLWTNIDRALPAKIPSLNHNYFGIGERIKVNIIASSNERDTSAVVTTCGILEQYLSTAPDIRLSRIRWALLSDEQVLLLGSPSLPVPGETYWSRKDQLLPTGFDFELFALSDLVQQKINPGRDHWILWSTTNTYSLVPKADVVPLSRSSFRTSVVKNSNQQA